MPSDTYEPMPRSPASEQGTFFQDSSATTAVGPRPSPEVLRLVQFNCQRLFSQQALLVDVFHGMLRDLVPDLRHLAELDERHISEQIVRSVLWTALAQDPVAEIERGLSWTGREIHERGFPRDGYLGVGHALLRSARTVSDEGWSSELSSAWVAYYSWLAELLTAGADAAQPGHRPRPEGAQTGTGQRTPSLDHVLAALRSRYFPADSRGLDAICTRVMLRTGADLRELRPDQRTDPAVIAEVLGTLTIMGYAPTAPAYAPEPPAAAVTSPDGRAAGPPARYTAVTAPPAVRTRLRQRSWFRWFRRRETR